MRFIAKISQLFGFLVLLAPLVFYSGIQFPYSIPRWVWLVTTVSVFFITSLIAHAGTQRYQLRRIDCAFGVLILIMCLSLFITTDIRQSLWSSAGRNTGVVLYIFWFLWFIAARLSDYSTEQWKRICDTALIVATTATVWGLIDFFRINDFSGRLTGPAGNALILATYLTPCFFIGAFMIAERSRFKLSRTHIGVILLCESIIASGIVLTLSRSSYLGVVLAVVIGAIGHIITTHKSTGFRSLLKRLVIASAVIIVIGGSLYTFLRVNNLGSDADRLVINKDSLLTLRTRFINWTIAARSIRQHPIVGVGWENYRTAADRLFDPALAQYSYYETRIDKPHNVFLEMWVTLGTIGFIAYLAFIWIIFSTAWRIHQKGLLTTAGFWSIAGFFIAYHVQNFFAFDTPQTLFIQGIILAYLASLDTSFWEISCAKFPQARVPLIVACTVVLSGVIVYASWGSSRTMWYINQGLQASEAHDFEKLDADARRAFSGIQGPYFFETWRWFAEALLKNYSAGASQLSDLTPDQRVRWEEDVTHIADLTTHYSAQYPDSVEWQTFAGKVAYYIALARNDDSFLTFAQQRFLRAYDISHFRQEPPILLSYIYVLQGDNARAIQWYETGAALSAATESDRAMEFLLNAFVKEKDNGSIVTLLETAVRFHPSADTYARLAAVYAEVKRFDDARAAVRTAIDLDPAFAVEGEAFSAGLPKK